MARAASVCLVLLAFVAGACAQVPSYASFYAALSKRPDMTTVKAAVDAVGLTAYLSDPTRAITVFCPDNAGFTALLQQYPKLAPLADPSKLGSLSPLQKNLLKQVLYYHMFSGVTSTADHA